MPRGKKYGSEEIILKLREAEVLMSQGTTQELAGKQIGVSTQTLIRWRKEYGGLRMDQAKRLKELEKENTRLKRSLVGALGLQGAGSTSQYAASGASCFQRRATSSSSNGGAGQRLRPLRLS